MSVFDFSFLGKGGQNMNNLPAYDVATAPINSGSGGSNFMDMLANAMKDPNIIRMMGDTGAKLSGPGTIGEAMGTGASNLVRARQLQKASEKQSTLMQAIADALKKDPLGRSLVGDPSDPNTLDSYTVNNKGITIKAPNPARVRTFEEEKPLESLKGNSLDQIPFL